MQVKVNNSKLLLQKVNGSTATVKCKTHTILSTGKKIKYKMIHSHTYNNGSVYNYAHTHKQLADPQTKQNS